ncbi:Protein UXT-like protein [Hordeum vulgare]|nr:Protein UXT-like protein [Hordeum vulgare]
MDDELEAAAGLASLASYDAAPAGRGKPRASCKTAALPKKKEELMPEERGVDAQGLPSLPLSECHQRAGEVPRAICRPLGGVGELWRTMGMIRKKDLREEKHRQKKKEQMNDFMKIQRRRLEMDAEKQAKMLELEEAKKAKMLEIEAANAKTKAKEVALASMKMGVEMMKVDLNTMSPRKRLWFEKMQVKMLKFDQL